MTTSSLSPRTGYLHRILTEKWGLSKISISQSPAPKEKYGSPDKIEIEDNVYSEAKRQILKGMKRFTIKKVNIEQ